MATVQRQKAACAGGTESCRAREVTKLPDQTTVATAANSSPDAAPRRARRAAFVLLVVVWACSGAVTVILCLPVGRAVRPPSPGKTS